MLSRITYFTWNVSGRSQGSEEQYHFRLLPNDSFNILQEMIIFLIVLLYGKHGQYQGCDRLDCIALQNAFMFLYLGYKDQGSST